MVAGEFEHSPISFGLGPALVLVVLALEVLFGLAGSGLCILGEYLLEGLEFVGAFGLVEGGSVEEGVEGRGGLVLVALGEHLHR